MTCQFLYHPSLSCQAILLVSSEKDSSINLSLVTYT
jgi:hypothetical protein